MFVRAVSIAAAFASAVASGAATAAPARDIVAMDVRYGDLNLASESGEQRLITRVRSAAAHVCGRAGSNGIRANTQVKECRSAAIADANREVTRAVAAARGTGPALAGGGSSITVSNASAEK